MHAGDLGLELGKTVKLEWHKAANTRLRCLRITSKEEKAVRKQLGVCPTGKDDRLSVCTLLLMLVVQNDARHARSPILDL